MRKVWTVVRCVATEVEMCKRWSFAKSGVWAVASDGQLLESKVNCRTIRSKRQAFLRADA